MRWRFSVLETVMWVGLATALVLSSVVLADDPKDQEVRVTNLRLKLEENQVLLSFKLAEVFDEAFERRLESGLLTGFGFQIQLVRDRKSWFDKGVDSGNLRVDTMYNAVTREYLVNFRYDGDLIESRVVRDVDELRKAMTEFESFPAFTVEGRARQQRLRVRLRAVLGTRTILFFIPSTVHTDWVETRKFQMEEPKEAAE